MNVTRASSATDTGRKRRRNEDAFVCSPPLFAVADGMGGAQAGEVASRLAAAALREDREEPDLASEERVVSLIQEANRRVYQRSSEDATASGMGTTMTVALLDADKVAIGHVGDSRAYLVRDGRLEQLTDDHSLVAELVRGGKLSPEEAETHPQRSVITRALGTDPDVDVDTFSVPTEVGDLFLLCSDGLTTMIDDDEILDIVEEQRSNLETMTHALVRAANRSGGEDNITVVAFEVGDEPPTAETQQLSTAEMNSSELDEDTLTGIPAPRPVDTMVVPVEQLREHLEATGSTPPPKRESDRGPAVSAQRFWLLLLAAIVVLVIVVAVVLWLVSR